jgi:hypothetical protein
MFVSSSVSVFTLYDGGWTLIGPLASQSLPCPLSCAVERRKPDRLWNLLIMLISRSERQRTDTRAYEFPSDLIAIGGLCDRASLIDCHPKFITAEFLAAAIRTVYPRVRQQRCWAHKMRNTLL